MVNIGSVLKVSNGIYLLCRVSNRGAKLISLRNGEPFNNNGAIPCRSYETSVSDGNLIDYLHGAQVSYVSDSLANLISQTKKEEKPPQNPFIFSSEEFQSVLSRMFGPIITRSVTVNGDGIISFNIMRRGIGVALRRWFASLPSSNLTAISDDEYRVRMVIQTAREIMNGNIRYE